jgi:hypothetical protein
MSADEAPLQGDRRALVPALATVLVLLAFAPRYGFHRDELYFMSNGDHLAWGYVDHPPLTPLLGRVSQSLFGDGVFGLRALSAVVAGAIVWVSSLVCRELGGSGAAQRLIGWAVASSSMVMAFGHMLTTPTLDVLAWTVSLWLMCRLIRTGDARWMVAVGAVIGIGLLNKVTVLIAVAGFGVALLVTPERRLLATRWTLVGALVALVTWAPHLVWQARNDWPVFEFSRGIADEAAENRTMALPLQALLLGPPVAVVVAIAMWSMVRRRLLAPYRFLAIGTLIVIAIVVATGGKPYYATSALPALVAVAAVWWERRSSLVDRARGIGRVAAGALAANAVVAAVMTLPVLPAEVYAGSPMPAVNSEPLEMIGWQEFVAQITDAYDRLDDGSKTAVILTGNYGEAGAIDHYGPAVGLPPAHSGHNSYADVRVPPGSAGPVLVVGYGDPSWFLDRCRPLDPIVMPFDADNEEQGMPMWACEAPTRPWAELWPSIRHID